MFKFWINVSIAALNSSIDFFGKSRTEIFRTVVLIAIVSVVTLYKYGWPKTLHDLKAKIRVFRATASVLLGFFIVVFVYQSAAEAYARFDGIRTQLSTEAQKCKTLQSAYDDLAAPQLRPLIINVFVAQAGDPENAVVGVESRVTNLGAETSIAALSLVVKFDDGRALKGTLAAGFQDPENSRINLLRDASGAQEFVNGRDYWISELSTALQRNGIRDGVLFSLVKNTTKQEILEKHATISFAVTDARGVVTVNEHRMTGDGFQGIDPNMLGLQGLQKHLNNQTEKR